MPTFRYATSTAQEAQIEAPDRPTALRELKRKGITPISIASASSTASIARSLLGSGSSSQRETSSAGSNALEDAVPVIPAKLWGKHMNGADLAMFMRELSTAVQAGLPLVQSLKTILRQVKKVKHRQVIAKLLDDVEHGRTLSDAMNNCGRTFPDLAINLTRAGEASGRLGEVMEQTATLLDRDVKLVRNLKSGLTYPAFLGVIIVIAIGVMVGFIVPTIIAPFKGQLPVSSLPIPTRIVMFTGDVVKGYWWVILGVAALIVVSIHQTYRSPQGRLSIDRFLLRVPILGKLLRDLAVARFTRTLGTLVFSGLPALAALRVTKSTLGNKALEGVIEEVCEQVSSGKTISDPMERSGYFPGLLTQIIALGERSGRLPQMLLQAANVFEDRTEQSLKAFTATFPIVMMLCAAAIIALIMAGVLLPLIQLQDLLGNA